MNTLTYLPMILVALAVVASFVVESYGRRHRNEKHFGFVS